MIDVADGYANFLVNSKKAVAATDVNVKKLEQEEKAKKLKEKQEIEEANKIKLQIQDKTLIFKVKVGDDGRLFGAVSTKQIVAEFEKQYGIKLDKRKISSDRIKELGYTKIKIQLHSDIEAEFQVLLTNK